MRISLNGHLYIGSGATFGIRRRRDGRTWKKDSMHSPNYKMCDFYCSWGYIPLGILAQKGLCRNRLGEKENTKIITTFRIILPMSSSDMTQNNWWGLHQSTIISITPLLGLLAVGLALGPQMAQSEWREARLLPRLMLLLLLLMLLMLLLLLLHNQISVTKHLEHVHVHCTMYMYMTIDHGQLLLLLSPHFIEIISILSLSIGLALIPVAFQTTSLGPVNSSPIFATNFGPPHLNQIPMVQAQWSVLEILSNLKSSHCLFELDGHFYGFRRYIGYDWLQLDLREFPR